MSHDITWLHMTAHDVFTNGLNKVTNTMTSLIIDHRRNKRVCSHTLTKIHIAQSAMTSMLQNKYHWLFFFSFHFSLSSADKHLREHSTADCVLCLYLFVLWSVRRCTLRINRSQAGAFKPQLDLLVLYQKLQVHLILELGDSKTTLRDLWLFRKTTTPIWYLDSIEATTISRSTDRRT